MMMFRAADMCSEMEEIDGLVVSESQSSVDQATRNLAEHIFSMVIVEIICTMLAWGLLGVLVVVVTLVSEDVR